MEFSSVSVEKASAMRRYRRKRRLEKALGFFNLCVAFLIFSRSSWLPIILQILFHLYTKFVSLFNHPLYVFLLGNVIIFFIYALSDKNGARNDVYDEFLDNTEPRRKAAADSESPVTLSNPQDHSPVNCSDDKQTICSEECPVSEEAVGAVKETTKTRTTTTTRTSTTTSSCGRVSSSMNSEKVSERKCYRRVESESYSRRTVVGGGRELKRVKTEVSREVVRYGGELERRLCTVENLSNEDFNRTVEDFIAKHRRMQWQEHRESQETECLPLTN